MQPQISNAAIAASGKIALFISSPRLISFHLKEILPKSMNPTFRTLGCRLNIFAAIDFHNLMKII